MNIKRVVTFLFATLGIAVIAYTYFSPPSPEEILVGPLNSVCNERCWQERRDKFYALFQERGLAAVLKSIAELYERNADFRRWCNVSAARVGELAYQSFPDLRQLPLGPEFLLCNHGFIYGYAEMLIRENKDQDRAQLFCDTIDKRFGREDPEALSSCYHGIGRGAAHVAARATNNDAPAILREALKTCEFFTSHDIPRDACARGVFNRVGRFYIDGIYGLGTNTADPLWFCHKEVERYRLGCYAANHRLLSSLLPSEKRDSFQEAIKFYKLLYGGKNEVAVSEAARSLAYEQAQSKVMRGNHSSSIAACRELESPSARACFQGFSLGLAQNGKPGYQYLAVIDFCKDAVGTSPSDYIDCLRSPLAYLKGIYTPQKFIRICDNIRSSLPDGFMHEVCQ